MSAAPASSTPGALGYRMPAEWDWHDATWVAWPHEARDWPGKFAVVPWTYAEIVRQLSWEENVEILVEDARHLHRARKVLSQSGVDPTRLRFHPCRTDRSWIRDSGPTFVRQSFRSGDARPSVGLVQWQFNAWAKYDNWQLDRKVPEWIAHHLRLPLWQARARDRWVVLEGGAIDVNGSGLLIATEECLLHETQARNPGLSRHTLEDVFREYLGVEEVVWLGRGITGDDTHGHVDDVARFVGPRAVLTVTSSDTADPDFSALRENQETLEDHRLRSGGRLDVRALPSPRPIVFAGQRLPASYANFYIANRTVLVPTFDDPKDTEALDVIRRSFPGREVVGIRSRDLVWGLGTIHCLTQQQPAALVSG